jgi:rhomboid protease GluP
MTAAGRFQVPTDVTPTSDDVLHWVAAASPHLWYPSRHAAVAGLPRNVLDDPLWDLRVNGLVQVGDWVKDVGQGFRLTAEGERAVALTDTPAPLFQARQLIAEQTEQEPIVEPDTGETARRSLLDPMPAVVTPILLVVNVVWFLFGGAISHQYRAVSDYLKGSNHPQVSKILIHIGAVSGGELLDGEWWRLLTCCFVHVGLFHLLCNMVTLGLLGTVAEGVWGRWRFLLIFLLSGVAGSVMAMTLHPQTEVAGMSRDLLLGGASGSLWGLTAAVIAWLIKNLKHLPNDVGPDWTRKLLIIAVMNVVVSFAPGVSLASHLGGAVGGVIVALCLARMRGDWRETLAAALGLIVLSVLFAGGLQWSFSRSKDWQSVKARWSERKARHAAIAIPLPPDTSTNRQ